MKPSYTSALLSLAAITLLGTLPAHAVHYWKGTSGATWSSTANWTTTNSGTFPSASAIATSADDVVFNRDGLTSNLNVVLQAAQAAKSITFVTTGSTTFRGNTGTTTTTRALTIHAGGVTKDAGSGVVNFNGLSTNGLVQVTIGVNQTWTNNSTTALNIGTEFYTGTSTAGILALNGKQLILDGVGDFQVGAAGTSDQALFGINTSSLIKQGAGTLRIGGVNTALTAPITVSAGTLYVTGTLGTSTVQVAATGTVGRNGATTNGGLGNGLTILAGGNLDLAGATLGAASTGILGVTGGSVTLGDLAFTDLLNWDFAGASQGTYQLIQAASPINLTTSFTSPETAFVFASGGNKGYFTTTGNSLNAVIVAVPEPSIALLGVVGLLALLRCRR